MLNWSLTLRFEHWLAVLENMKLRKTFGSKIEEATGNWRKLDNRMLRDLFFSQNIIWVMNKRGCD
jgi:hypothetical protein